MKKRFLFTIAILIVLAGGIFTYNKFTEQQRYTASIKKLVVETLKENMSDYQSLQSDSIPMNIIYDKERLEDMYLVNNDGFSQITSIRVPNNEKCKRVQSQAILCLEKALEEVSLRKGLQLNPLNTDKVVEVMSIMNEANILVAELNSIE